MCPTVVISSWDSIRTVVGRCLFSLLESCQHLCPMFEVGASTWRSCMYIWFPLPRIFVDMVGLFGQGFRNSRVASSSLKQPRHDQRQSQR